MISRTLYYLSLVVIAVTVVIAGIRMWRDAKPRRPSLPVAVAIAPGGHVEVSADRRHVTRVGVVAWRTEVPVPIDLLAVTGALIIGRGDATLAALDLETGRVRFTWALPTGERWAVPVPVVLGRCLLVSTARSGDGVVRCLADDHPGSLAARPQSAAAPAREPDPVGAPGAVVWAATLAGRECARPPVAIPGAYLVQCPGWTTILDATTGAQSVDAGGVSLVQRDPPVLLRAGSQLVLAPWLPAQHRFAPDGEPVRGTADVISTSAVMHGDRLVVRAASSSDQLAIVRPRAGEVIVVVANDAHLADDTPLVDDCGDATSPRFQLLELAPRLGETYDPARATERRLALLDVETGTLTWTSYPLAPIRPIAAAARCRGGDYLVPLELRGADGRVTSALWIVDARTGKSVRSFAIDAELGPYAVDDTRLVAIGEDGAFEQTWRAGASEVALEPLLGPLP